MFMLAGSDPFAGEPMEGLYRSFRRLKLVGLCIESKRSFGPGHGLNEEEGPVQQEMGYKPWQLISLGSAAGWMKHSCPFLL